MPDGTLSPADDDFRVNEGVELPPPRRTTSTRAIESSSSADMPGCNLKSWGTNAARCFFFSLLVTVELENQRFVGNQSIGLEAGTVAIRAKGRRLFRVVTFRGWSQKTRVRTKQIPS
jgi:hypothetical protein